MRREQDPSADVLQKLDVTAAQNDVSEPLLPIDQDGLSRDLGLAQPQRLAPAAVSDRSPTPILARLVTGPPGDKLPRQEVQEPFGVGRLRIIRLQRERPVKT